ncbi:hypothetical protein RDI58_014976 [Solanum bulbocastanum]|uniref:Uncharacterized protein n=1 Tax=Solanum bulbocastanum TaxID=147425 RepID=A0AAN8TJA6_SOLBU
MWIRCPMVSWWGVRFK